MVLGGIVPSSLRSTGVTAVRTILLVGIAVLYQQWLRKLRYAGRKKVKSSKNSERPQMDTRRAFALTKGQAIDHKGAVVLESDPDFDLNWTIFASVEGFLARSMMRRQLSMVPHWRDDALQALRWLPTPQAPPLDRRITDFMETQCNFKMEHADGSFLDHVTFCHDYCAAHYKAHSPRVLLLHSILGVGTNVFPMEVGKLPELAALVSPEELKHIEAFPSFLRLLVAGSFLEQLESSLGSLDKLQSVVFRRVIDNKELEMDAAAFWVQLNYQVIHLIDFLPVADWDNRGEPLFQIFIELRRFLIKAGKLEAKVDLGATCEETPEEEKVRLVFQRPVARVKSHLAKNAIQKYSADIGHNLDFTFKWAA